MSKFCSADDYFQSQEKWKDSLLKLREIAIYTDLDETLKWSIPTYTYQSKNIFSISAFKAYFGVWFFQGKFLSDPNNLLVNAQEGKTEGMRQMRFDESSAIKPNIIKSYMFEAIENHKQGKKISPKAKPLVIPNELSILFESDTNFADDFNSLTLSKKREYAEYINEAKR